MIGYNVKQSMVIERPEVYISDRREKWVKKADSALYVINSFLNTGHSNNTVVLSVEKKVLRLNISTGLNHLRTEYVLSVEKYLNQMTVSVFTVVLNATRNTGSNTILTLCLRHVNVLNVVKSLLQITGARSIVVKTAILRLRKEGRLKHD